MSNDKLIVALDFSDAKEALDLVKKLGDNVTFYKVGMQLFYGAGQGVIEELVKQEKKIFLDLKLHDIPNTVAGAIKSLGNMGVDLLTIHGTGGPKMMTAAAEAREKFALKNMKIIAVTVLTSIDDEEREKLSWKYPIDEYVIQLAQMAQKSGIDGVVSSPHEVEQIKKICGKDFLAVTPGIRLPDSDVGDQSRIATPKMALQAGSDYLVIGRPITKASDPRGAAESILKEMDEI